MARLYLYFVRLYVCTLAKVLWQNRRVRFVVWLLAFVVAVWRFNTGCLTLDDVINDILIGVVLSVPFLRYQ